MARKKRFSLNDIMDAAFLIVRRNGMRHLTARAIADALNSSTMPVYTHLKSMHQIKAEMVRRAWELLREYQITPRSGDPYIDMGLGYVLFARDEKNLFQCIHTEAYQEINAEMGEENFEFHLARLMADDPVIRDISRETARKALFYGWLFTHGFATLLTSGIGREVKRMDNEKAIIAFFNDVTGIFQAGLLSTKGVETEAGESMRMDSKRAQDR